MLKWRSSDYTCDHEYMSVWSKLIATHNVLKKIINDNSKPTMMTIEGFGEIQVGHLHIYPGVRDEAFDMKI